MCLHLEVKITLDQVVKDMERLEKDPEVFVFDIFQEVRRQIDLRRDSIIEEAHKNSEAMIKQLNELEAEIKANIKSVKREGLDELKSVKVPQWEQLLKNPKIELGKLQSLFTEINQSVVSLDENIKQYESKLMMDKQIKFEPFDSFGHLYVNCRLERDDGYYVGEVVDGKGHGKGELYLNSGEKYIGGWLNGERHGKGTHYYQNGDKYEGEFMNGVKHGKGTYYWSDGHRYVGDWKEYRRSGHGVFYWANGNRYDGEWMNDQRHGTGIHYYADGEIERQRWENGRQIN